MDYQEDDTQYDEANSVELLDEGNESSYYSSEDAHSKPKYSPIMYVLFGLSGVIVTGYIVLKLYGGGYHYWVYGLLVLLLLLANLSRLSGLRRLRVRSVIGSFVVFLLLASIISFSANSEKITNYLMEPIMTDVWTDTSYEYYYDNMIWHGRVYKKYSSGAWHSKVYTYDRQGNLISESDWGWCDTPFE